jgi:Inner membrane protein YgaP-like, transmembrane domain
MSTERRVRLLAGSMVAISLLLGYFVAPAWLLLAVFVALNLIQSAFTGFCPAEKFLAPRRSDDGRSRPASS